MKKHFLITRDCAVKAFASATGVEGTPDFQGAAGLVHFESEESLTALCSDYTMKELAEIWNRLPGVKPVAKFMDRKTAAKRIWTAIQTLPVEVQAEARAEAKSTKISKTKKAMSTLDRRVESTEAAPESRTPRAGSKTGIVLHLLRRVGGVTGHELMEATGWQAHSVRGFLSGTVGKKLGLTVISSKTEKGGRTYTIEEGAH